MTPAQIAFIAIPSIMFIFGLFIGRWNGGGRPKWLKWLDNPFSQMLYAYPILLILLAAVPAAVQTEPNWLSNWLSNWHIFVVYVASFVMILKGHGHNMDLGTSDESKPNALPEWYEGIIQPLYGKIPNYWYDALGLVISGVTYTLPAGIYLGNPALAFVGAVKAPMYMLGREISKVFSFKELSLSEPTAFGEALTCAAIHALLGTILVHILVNLGFI